jgi:hypothetical protein
VLTPGDEGFVAAALAWNVRYAHRPAVIVMAETSDDVARAVAFARARHMKIAVQSSGHGFARAADDALLISLRRLDDVDIDPQARTARIAGGAKWWPVLEQASAVGLAPLLGSTPDVGAVGYTLGGGMGWLARKHGLSIDAVRSFEIVTTDGELKTASADVDPELFWALRGGGAGGLGIVTAMTVDLVPVDMVYAGNLLYPAAMAREVMARYAAWVETTPDELTSSVVLMNMPPLEEVPEPLRGQSFVIIRGCFCGPLDEGAELMRFWRDWEAPAFDMFGPMPFGEAATISNDPVDPMPAAVSTEWLTDIDDEVAETLIEATYPAGGPPLLVFSEVRHVGGAVHRNEGGAFGVRDSSLLLEMVAITPTEEIALAADAHIRALRFTLAPHTTGQAYLNFCEGEEKRARTEEGFSPEKYDRLKAVKARMDRDDLMAFGLDLTR